LEEPEVQIISVVSALETECNVSDTRSITDCQWKEGQCDGNCKWHMASMAELNRQDNSKKIQEDNNEENLNTTLSKSTNAEVCPIAKAVIQKHTYNVSVPRPKAGTVGGTGTIC